ncbi:putative bifunctional diguanylate cyclase/phosphodiesterase [Trujillonella endophytica]|uniref:Diguanylate cyclase (GGDEF) domain-containing protein n=1 Tax=Trujillonella endophytica TaxID=673521 RepID=A0A1H8WH23_9ACTN|nr:EAL domain-containing protein [Trujillella endophytica]SEP26975.1 diguanylate cyclase (GGDEF) domain-containing protein [Trujillella endophytica]
MSTPTRRTRRGLPLWLYLATLALIPQVGVVGLTTYLVRDQQSEVESARRAEQAVQALAQLDVARNGVEDEIVPALSSAVIADRALAELLGLPASVVDSVAEETRGGMQATRVTTDEALAALPSDLPGSASAGRAEQDLHVVRASLDAAQLPVEDVFFRYLDVANSLAQAQAQAADAASAEEIPATTLRAIQDVEIVTTLAQSSARMFPLFLASQLDAGDLSAGSRIAGQASLLAYQDAVRRMGDLSQPELAFAWQTAHVDPLMTSLDAMLAAQAEGTLSPLTPADLIALMERGAERDVLLTALVDGAMGSLEEHAAGDVRSARSALESTLQFGLGLVLLSIVAGAAVALRITRALGVLADRAGRVSEGSLVDVEVAGPREVRTVSAALRQTVRTLRRLQDQAAAVARGDLDDRLLDQPLPGPLGEVVHASVQQMVTSVRQREELQVALAHRATHDPLTELPNRAQAVAAVAGALHRAQRSGGTTGLLFVDLDGFKAVNDRFGHACGDAVLRATATRMLSAVRAGDTVCRLGGDEFVVLVEQVEDERELVLLAERLVAAVSRPVHIDGVDVRVGASIGVAVSRDGGTDTDVFFAEADTAAYRAKARGRGRAEVFDDDLRRQLSARAETEAAIAAGLAAGEMCLEYQPVHDVMHGGVTGFEALVRWHRPGVGAVPPDQFVPVAEASALICDIDRWVLHEATRQLAEWRRAAPPSAGGPAPTVAVNISGRHLAEPSVVSDVADALAASGLPPALLVIEVTETVLVSDPMAYEHLATLREMGVGIAIDDFGTGYTSIGQLRHMPVDTLKIDRSFIGSTDPGHEELVALMIRAAHTFGLTVVAEGVEEPEQLERLRAESCDSAQGYLLHRPLPAAEAGALIGAVPAGLSA